MPSWPPRLLAALREQLPTLLILAALGGLAWWGYANDWKAPKLAKLLGKQSEEDENAKKEEKRDEPDLKPVQLDADIVEKVGIDPKPLVKQVLTRKVSASARLAYDQSWYAHLSTRAPGVVWKVYKTYGDSVAKNDVLALIAAEALGKAKADFLQTLIEVEIKRRLVERLRSLGESVPQSQRIDAELSLRQSRTRLLSDKQTLNNLGFSLSIEEYANLSEDEASRRLSYLGLPADLRKDPNVPANLLPIRALFDGVVVERDIVEGEVASATPPQFAVANLGHLWIELSLHPEDARKVKKGHEVEFIPEGDMKGDRKPLGLGDLTWVSPEVDPKTRLVRARAEVRNPLAHKEALRPNTYGTADVILERTAPLLMIPASAVQVDKGRSFVFVLVPHSGWSRLFAKGMGVVTFEPHEVKLGIHEEDRYEVQSGLKVGDELVITGSQMLKGEMLKSRLGGGDD